MDVPDVYITSQQETQVFYLPWACQSDPNLKGWDVVYEVSPRVRPPPPMKMIMHLTLTQTHMKENSSNKCVFPKKHFKNRSTSPQNIEVDSDSEPEFTPQPEQEEPDLQEVTVADDLTMLDRLRKGGLPHDDACIY